VSSVDARDDRLTHLASDGSAHMVDVGHKASAHREAVATALVQMRAETLALILEGGLPKGDVLATARIGGIMAAKRTAELIPLCHVVPLTSVDVEFVPEPGADAVGESGDAPAPGRAGLRVTATAIADARTGVEMEALTAAAVAGLTVYDMCKAVDRGMTLGGVALVRKQGGASGTWTREEPAR
jgi:cyclic pyranopterin phosphate synthase